jgi:hypothetical protein
MNNEAGERYFSIHSLLCQNVVQIRHMQLSVIMLNSDASRLSLRGGRFGELPVLRLRKIHIPVDRLPALSSRSECSGRVLADISGLDADSCGHLKISCGSPLAVFLLLPLNSN